MSRNIEASQSEIDHVGLNALFEVLLKQAGIALEVMYLDRSAGTELVPHRFDAADASGMPLHNAPTVRLLYRPGHYDILYAFGDRPVQPIAPSANGAPHQPITVQLASPADDGPGDGLHSTPYQNLGFVGLMPMIPGMSGVSAPGISGTEGLWMSPAAAPTPAMFPASTSYDFAAQPSSVPIMTREYAAAPIKSEPPTPVAVRQPRFQPVEYFSPAPVASPASYMPLPPNNPTDMFRPSTHMVTPSHAMSMPPASLPSPVQERGGGSMFRPSIWEFESRYGESARNGIPSVARNGGFQTSIFRK